MKVVTLNWLPSKVNGFMFYPFVVVNGTKTVKKKIEIMTHEAIHYYQARELYVLPFYVMYIYYFIVNLFKYRFDLYTAYITIRFEIEAYLHQNDYKYLKTRRKFAWKKKK